jgi:hypothetical protein
LRTSAGHQFELWINLQFEIFETHLSRAAGMDLQSDNAPLRICGSSKSTHRLPLMAVRILLPTATIS